MRSVDRAPTCVVALLLLAAGACSVPEKDRVTDDGGPVADAGSGIDGPGAPDDGEPPDTVIDARPGEFSSSGQATFRFSSNDPAATFTCQVDREQMVPCQAPYVRTLPDGPHSFAVRAIDRAGNGDDSPAEALWSIDTVPPDTSLSDFPPSADNSVMVEFAFESGEDNVEFDCSLDNAGYVPCISGGAVGPVGDGAHSFAVRARDRAGNIDPSPAIYAWTVNTATPDTKILSAPPDASANATASFTFLSEDAGGGARFECAIDGAAFAACTSPRSYAGLSEGDHTFQVRVIDRVGNRDPTPADRTWTVDLTAPSTTIVAAPSGTLSMASASFMFDANEKGVTFACRLDNAAFAPCTSPASYSALAQGAHTFVVVATDAAGHADPSPATQTWTVDTVTPQVDLTGPGEGATVGPRVVVAFTVNEGTVTCSLDGAPFTACTSPFADNLPAGPHSIAVRSVDAATNTTTATRSLTVACSPPNAANGVGALHLDTADQSLPNASGGAPATLGDTAEPEPTDPTLQAAGRFGGALSFDAAANQHVEWPLALAAAPDLTLELWANPGAPSGARDIAVSADGRVALRVAAASATTVRFSISIHEGEGGVIRTVTSGTVAASAWHHVIASLQQPALRLWIDGARSELATVELTAPLALDALRLGGDGAAAYDGALDEIWLSQTAITADEPALARYCPL